MSLIFQVGVKAFLQNKEGKYLLVHRRKEKYPELENMWDIVGGRINPGTPLLKNLRREIQEETGLILQDTPEFIAAQDIIVPNHRHTVRLTYIGKIDGDVVIDMVDHDSYQWFSLAELQTLDGLDDHVRELLPTIHERTR